MISATYKIFKYMDNRIMKKNDENLQASDQISDVTWHSPKILFWSLLNT